MRRAAVIAPDLAPALRAAVIGDADQQGAARSQGPPGIAHGFGNGRIENKGADLADTDGCGVVVIYDTRSGIIVNVHMLILGEMIIERR